MSRGPGQMQQLILAALKPAKQAYANGEFDYIGGAGLENLMNNRSADPIPLDQLQARQGGEYYTLEEGVYDLRCTLRYLAIHWPKRWGVKAWRNPDRSANFRRSSYWFMGDAFRISFMRAARGLVDRGLL